VRHLIAEVGVSQIVLGTDNPFGWNTTAVDHLLATPGASDDDKRAMLGETAAKLLGIKVWRVVAEIFRAYWLACVTSEMVLS
jgi:aminocarboxymuconate-semialdehyde decarboxylase